MSLKGFHIVFVTICTLLCMFLAVWAFALAPERTAMTMAYGIVGICGAVLMPIYGVYFYRKIIRNHL